jgi:hypothetical protein
VLAMASSLSRDFPVSLEPEIAAKRMEKSLRLDTETKKRDACAIRFVAQKY